MVRLGVLIFGFLLVQSTIGLDVRILNVHPDLMLLLPIAGGLLAGPRAGALVGFATGIAADLLLPTPFGLSSLVGCLLGFGVGSVSDGVGNALGGAEATPWLAPLAALAGSAIAVMLYAVLGAVLGQEQMLQVDFLAVVLVVSVVNALLAIPAVALMRWALVEEGSRRRASRRRSTW